jgi:RHS repeat-associated protein
MKLQRGAASLTMTSLGAAPSAVERSGASIAYRDAFPNTDLRYTLDNERVKEELILGAAPTGAPAYAFEVGLDGVTVDRQGGGIRFLGGGAPEFAVPSLVMSDSAPDPTTTTVAFDVTVVSRRLATITLLPDLAWLTDPARVYPVVIDPSVVVVQNQPTGANSDNATVDQGTPNQMYYGETTLRVGKNPSGQFKDTLIKFPNMISFPREGVITDAKLRVQATTGTNGLGVEVHRTTSDWDDTTVTWNTAPGFSGTVDATGTLNSGAVTEFDLTSLIRAIWNNTYPNYGLRLRSTSASGQNMSLNSGWAICSDCQPRLDITFVPATRYGRNPLWTYTSAEHGGGNTSQVEVSGGNLVFTHAGGSIDARGFSVPLTHTYNSADPFSMATYPNAAVFGEGWTFAWNQRLFSVDSGRAVVFKDGTGDESRIFLADTISNGNRSYIAPKHYGYTLVEDISTPPADKVWTLTEDVGNTKHFFDAAGKQTRVEDRKGNYLNFAYDDEGRLATITDVAGRQTVLTYIGEHDRLAQITDMAGRISTYAYDAAGNLTTITHGGGTADEVTTTLGYDDGGRLVSVTNPRGHTSQIGYSAFNRWETAGSVDDWTVVTPIPQGTTVSIAQSSTFVHAGSGSLQVNLTNVGDTPASVKKDMSAQPRRLSSVTHELLGWLYIPHADLDARWTIEYTDFREIIGPWQMLTVSGWTGLRLPSALVDPGMEVRALRVDFRRHPGESEYTGEVWIDDVGLRGQVASQTDAKPTPNTVATYAYHIDGNTDVARPDDTGTFRTTTYAYDIEDGTVTSVTDPLGHTTSAGRDDLLRVFTVTPAGTGAVPYQYAYYPNSMQLQTAANGAGETLHRGADLATGDTTYLTDPRNEYLRSTNANYDAIRVDHETATGNVMAVVQNQYSAGTNLDTNLNAVPLSERRRMDFTYFSGGLLQTMTDPLGHVTNFDYLRDRGYLTLIDAPPGTGEGSRRQTTFDRNADGSVNFMIDPKGQRTTYEYDGLGRLKKINYGVVNGVPAFSLSYGLDVNGNLVSMTDRAGSTTWTYDENNRVITESRTQNGTTKTANYAYNANGTLRTITTFGNQTSTLGYNAALQLTSQTDPKNGGGTIIYGLDDRGRLKAITYPSGVKQTIAYDVGDHVTEVVLKKANNTLLQKFTYDYGLVNGLITANYRWGFPLSVTELDGSVVTYTYDNFARLASAVRTGTNPFNQAYTYDKANNRLTFTNAGSTTTYTYDNANQLATSTGGVTYGHDRNGNLLSYTGNTFTYDASNKWVSGTIGGAAMTYSYDGQGRQVSRGQGANRTDYWFDQTGMTLETGLQSGTYLRDPGGLLLSASSGSTFVNYGRDRLGSITATVGTNQSLAGSNRYNPWGSTISASGTLNRLRFTGARRDVDTGFYAMGQRQYISELARFTQLDPLPQSVTDVNRFAYAGCNPVNYVDPTGTQFEITTQGEMWGCDQAELGLGLGLFWGGAGIDLALALADLFSLGLATPAVAVGIFSATTTAVAGLAIIQAACPWIPG